MKDSSKELFGELAFLASIQPQIVRLRKMDVMYPDWCAGMIAVITGGKEFDDANKYYLRTKFYPFAEDNEKIAMAVPINKSSLYLYAMLSNPTGYWMPFYQDGRCVINRRFKLKPYYGEL